ncbi:MAG: hypothetical protein ABGY09_00200, partial [Euryarchaeota archaeon]
METEVTVVLIGLVVLMLAPMVWDCCTGAGSLPTDLDLVVQAVKAYLLGRYGPSAGDWDPHSYLGRPPLVNYPVVPFLLPALLTHYLDPALACSVSEYVYRMVPVLVWVALRLLGVDSPGSLGALLAYLLLYPVYLLHNAAYVRVATTLAYCAFTTAVIVWYSRLNERSRLLASASLLYLSLLSNFVYTMLPTVALALLESRAFLVPVLAASPVLYVAYEFGRLSFSNVPASCHLIYPVSTAIATMHLLLLFALTAATVLVSLLDSRRTAAHLGSAACLATLAGLCMTSPGAGKLLVGSLKTLTQLDLQRLPIVPSLTLTVGIARVGRRSLPPAWALLGVPLVGIVTLGSIMLPWTHLSSLLTGRCDGHAHRDLIAGTVDSIFPWRQGRLGFSLAGAFHQGSSEPVIRVLTAAYYPLGIGASGYSDYVHRPGANQPFDLETARKVLTLLPAGRLEISSSPVGVNGPWDVMRPPRARSEVRLRDALPIDRVRALYVGSFTDYSYLWLNVVRHAPVGGFPVIPCLRPRDLLHRQQLDASRYWTGDVLIVDPEAAGYPGLARLVKRARVVIVVYSSPALDGSGPERIVRLVRRYGKRPLVVGPVHHPLPGRVLRPLMVSIVRWSEARKERAVRLVSNDRMVVTGVRTRLALIPWGWAPFWAVNGREGEACPAGPYMLVRLRGGAARLHYVGWERHQRPAYACSVLLFLAGIAAVTPTRVRR